MDGYVREKMGGIGWVGGIRCMVRLDALDRFGWDRWHGLDWMDMMDMG